MRCFNCKKKTHLEFSCSCEHKFCVSCRLPEDHKCNVKREDKVVLIKVVADKLVDKI